MWEVMGYRCKSKCELFKSIHPHGMRYEDGEKRCTICQIYVRIEMIRCPCCGSVLRTKKRDKQNTEKFVNDFNDSLILSGFSQKIIEN